mgnify:FL=1|jgi:peroxiredoxin
MKAFTINIVGAALILGVVGMAADVGWSMGGRIPAVGAPAAEFSLVDLQGKTHSLAQYKGQVVLLNFWATWCKPCTTEMPAMQSAYDQFREKGFVVLAVNELEDDVKVREHIKAYGHTFPVLMDHENRVANMYGVFGLPVSVFIDEQGVVREYIKGGLLTEQKIHEVMTRLKGQPTLKAASLH